MFSLYFTATFMAICCIGFGQQVRAQQCQKDTGSAFLNTDITTTFQQAYVCRSGNGCQTKCEGALSSICCNSYACFCTDSGFPCSVKNDPVEASATDIFNTCTHDYFYYGEYVDSKYQYTGPDSALFSVRDANWPNAEGLYVGNGVVQMGKLSKYYSFYHRMADNPTVNLGTYSDASCYARMAFAFVDGELVTSNPNSNFGAGQAPAIGTCAEDTSCPLGDCSLISGATKCCFDGTCICTKDTSICADSSKILTVTSTNACQKSPPELFYYAEFVTALPVQTDGLFFSTLTKQDSSLLYVGTGVIDLQTNGSGALRKDVFFLHKYSA